MKTALIIPVYNRPQYVKRCFESLEKLTVKPDYVVIVDDASTEPLPKLSIPHEIIRHEKNTGVKGALLTGIEHACKINDVYYIINLDSDAIVKPDFITRLRNLHFEIGAHERIISGFNCESKGNPIIHESERGNAWHSKRFCNGINMCFNKRQYETYIRPALNKHGNWDYNVSLAVQHDKQYFLITIPSCVQHIGMISSMGHTGADRAHDFKTLSLPDVTLFGIDSHDVAGIKRAAEISQRDIEFGAVKIITDDLFTKGGSNEQRREDYSKFMIKHLTEHFATSHVLTIHADGYVLNEDAWDPEWLQYDYIGATWWYKDNMNVGNGGFSLRSKKLCDILSSYDLAGGHYHPEDHHICRTYRPALETLGIKFAPEEVANRFSIEAYLAPPPANRWTGQFGFHSVNTDLSMLPEDIRYRKNNVRTPELRVRKNNLRR